MLEPEPSSFTPTALNHIVGQRAVVQQVRIAVDAAFADRKPMDHALLVGPPGLGKTALARVIAHEMASELHEVLGQSIRRPADLNELLLKADDNDIIHIDECHELDKEFQVALYRALDERKPFLRGRCGRAFECITIANFTLLLSTTDEYRILQPLRDRMKLTLRFQLYAEDEIIRIIRHSCHARNWMIAEGVFPEVAKRSRGTPRLGLRLLESCRRISRAQGDEDITLAHLQSACDLEHLDDLGLGPDDQRYLALLAERPQPLAELASRLGLPERTVAGVIEPFLFRMGFVAKDRQRRRQLTQLACNNSFVGK